MDHTTLPGMTIDFLDLMTIFVFFIYGLAFFSMGLAIMLESRRSPLLAEARALGLLALFGFLHGAHEWVEMAILGRQWVNLDAGSGLTWIIFVRWAGSE